MTILETIRKRKYPTAVLVEDLEEQGEIRFKRDSSTDEVWLAVKDGAVISIYDHEEMKVTDLIMEYIPIDYETVKGYSKLTEPAKRLFESTYVRHNSAQGTDYKTRWLPIRVTEHRDHLKVYYRDGAWLHFYPGGSWG